MLIHAPMKTTPIRRIVSAVPMRNTSRRATSGRASVGLVIATCNPRETPSGIIRKLIHTNPRRLSSPANTSEWPSR